MTNPTSFKDLFSTQSVDYSRFRPTYPSELFDYLAKVSPSLQTAWDCGTGNGQAAIALASHFKQVIATDPSEKQLSKATPNPKVEYRQASAESSTLPPNSIDCITVAQAFHWFRQEEFFSECARVLKPGGVLALWTYDLAKISPQVDEVVLHLYRDILGPYWEMERTLVEEGYRGVRMPWPELSAPRFEMKASWNLSHLLGYLGTWSALQSYIRKRGENPLETLAPQFAEAWGAPDQFKQVTWELSLKICKRS